MTHDPHPWAETLPTLHEQVWARLVRGVADRRAPARHPTLATVTPDGLPRARTVVLRAADPRAATLDLHTDVRSAKVTDLRATPHAALHVWDASARLQMRLEATVGILEGAAVETVWARVPEASRRAYGGTPHPGQPIADVLVYSPNPRTEAFAVLRLHLTAMDILHLGPMHRRARFERASSWQGQWLAP